MKWLLAEILEESTEAPSLETEDISGNEESVSSGEMTE